MNDFVEIITLAVFFISLYGLVTSANIVKSIVFLSMMETAVFMFFLSIGYSTGILPPFGPELIPGIVADPLPQALMITAVVVGLCGTAVNIIVFITLFRRFGTANWVLAKNKNVEQDIC